MDLAAWFQELRRRRVIRALLGWGLLSFAVLQVVEPVMHALDLKDWVLKVVVGFLAAGFPVAAILSWFFDLGVGGVSRTPDSPSGGTDTPRAPVRKGALVGLVLVAAIVGAGLAILALRWMNRQPDVAPSVAVLPFADMSQQHDQEYFADGIAEEILNALTQFKGLKVIGRTSSFSFKGKNEDLRTVGQKLGVATILEGSVRKQGDKIRVTAQLIRAADGSHLWSQTFERALADVFAVQDEVARDVARALQVRLLPGRLGPPAGSRTTNPAAYSHYLLGLHFNRQGNMEGFLRARESYEKALALDPGYVPARARLGLVLRDIAYRQSRKLADTRALYQQGLAETERAIAMGPDLADGYAARGLYRLAFLRDWKGALDDTQRAIELDPGDNPAHRRHAVVLASQGKVQDAIAELRLASELDPLSPPAWVWLATMQAFAGQLDDAERSVRRVLDAYPQNDDALERLATIRLLQGRPADALQDAGGIGKSDRFLIEAIALHELGREAESRKALAELRERAAEADPALLATAYGWMGDRDRAFEWLDRALELELWDLKFNPMLRKLHPDPRWAALLRKMNLPVD